MIKRNPKEFIITVVNEKISKCNENKVDVNENSLRVFGNIDHFMGTMRECNECQELLVTDTEKRSQIAVWHHPKLNTAA